MSTSTVLGFKSKKEFIESFNFYLQKYGLMAIPLSKGFKIANYEVDRDALEMELISLYDELGFTVCNFISCSDSVSYDKFILSLDLFKKDKKLDDGISSDCGILDSDLFIIDSSIWYYLVNLNNFDEDCSEEFKNIMNKNLEDSLDNKEDKKNMEDLYTEKAGFIYTAKDLIMAIVGIGHIAASVISFNKFKTAETKPKKALWIGVVIGNILGAVNSVKKLSDSLLLPDNCDELEEEEE